MVLSLLDFHLVTSDVQLKVSQLTIGFLNLRLVLMVLFRFRITACLKFSLKVLLKSKFEIVELESLLHSRIVRFSPCKPLLSILNPDGSVGCLISQLLKTDLFWLLSKCGCSILLFLKNAICFVLFSLKSCFSFCHCSQLSCGLITLFLWYILILRHNF